MQERINSIILKNLVRADEYKNRKVFFINKEGFEKLWELREKEIQKLIEEGIKEERAKKEALKPFLKIINHIKGPVKFLNYGVIPAYTLVIDKQKILERYLDIEFQKWAKQTRINAKKEARNINDEVEIYKYMQKVENIINQAEDIKEDIKANPDKYDLIYTRYLRMSEEQLMQPVIYFYLYKKNRLTTSHEYLRKEVPNVIYEAELEKPVKKRIKEIEKRLSQMKNPFGNIYIKEKNDS